MKNLLFQNNLKKLASHDLIFEVLIIILFHSTTIISIDTLLPNKKQRKII